MAANYVHLKEMFEPYFHAFVSCLFEVASVCVYWCLVDFLAELQCFFFLPATQTQQAELTLA